MITPPGDHLVRPRLQAPKEDVANGAWVREKDVADIMGWEMRMGMGMGIPSSELT